MEKNSKSYKDLIAWQKAVDMVSFVYSITKTFPGEEKFGLVNQINRAAISIPANIAEGWGRESSKNFLQFLRISRGSAMELETLLIIANNLGYIDKETNKNVSGKIEEVSKILQGLIKSVQQKINLTESV